ncbi:MAG: SLC13 family permease, partial [Verrucomicrobiales bacterium]
GTSTNLVAAGIAQEHDQKLAFSMFDITPLGLVFVAVTFVYLLTVGKKLLPDRVTLAALIDSEDSREFITHAFVGKDSALVNAAFTETSLAKMKRARVLEVLRDGVRVALPLNEIVFAEGDEIVLKGKLDGLMDLSGNAELNVRGEDALGLEGVRTESAVLMEGIIGPDSSMAGKSLKELDFRRRHGVLIVAVHRRGKNLKERFEDVKLAFGDTLLVQGPAEKMRHLFRTRDFVNLSEPKRREVRPHKAPLAIFALLAFMLVGALGGLGWIPPVPIVLMALGGAFFVLVTKCLQPSEAYRAIEWKVIFIIIGMMGLGNAMQNAGLTVLMAERLVSVFAGMDPRLMIAAFYLLAVVLTEMVSNNAVAVLLTPLAIVVADQLGVDARPFIVAVMFGSSASFATPIGYQTNTFVYGAGGYRFGDFFRVGAPLSLILWIVASLLIPVLWPL